MAKQEGNIYATGCYVSLCFYRLNGAYYARMKSTLSGERVKRDPAFSETMKYAGRLAEASKQAAELYKQLPAEERKKGAYQRLVGACLKSLPYQPQFFFTNM